jgi:hypothetical protein
MIQGKAKLFAKKFGTLLAFMNFRVKIIPTTGNCGCVHSDENFPNRMKMLMKNLTNYNWSNEHGWKKTEIPK